VTLRARWVTLRARRVTLRARWVTPRARWGCLLDHSVRSTRKGNGSRSPPGFAPLGRCSGQRRVPGVPRHGIRVLRSRCHQLPASCHEAQLHSLSLSEPPALLTSSDQPPDPLLAARRRGTPRTRSRGTAATRSTRSRASTSSSSSSRRRGRNTHSSSKVGGGAVERPKGEWMPDVRHRMHDAVWVKVRVRFPARCGAAERRHPTGRERMGSPTLRTPQEPILLLPWVCFRGGGFPNPSWEGSSSARVPNGGHTLSRRLQVGNKWIGK
jgi:hypothetical protein